MSTSKVFGTPEILRSLPYKAVSATVDPATTGTVVEGGVTLLKAGTLVAGKGGSIFDGVGTIETNTTAPQGVLLHDVNVNGGQAASVVYAGEAWAEKVNGGNVTSDIAAALPLIKFIKEK